MVSSTPVAQQRMALVPQVMDRQRQVTQATEHSHRTLRLTRRGMEDTGASRPPREGRIVATSPIRRGPLGFPNFLC